MSQIKLCPYCGEEIKAIAIKCRFCGSLLSGTSSAPEKPEPTTQVKFAQTSKYELIEEIGRGGMAIVYKAVQKNLNRTVALKVLPRQFTHDQDFLKRFHREAREAAALNHPNIVTIFDEGVENNIHYIAMEYLNGIDLRSLIRQQGPMKWEAAAAYLHPIANALGYAHKKGVVHRDVKSSNVFIVEGGRPVLMDFGIAYASNGEELTVAGTIIGTPEYMSPEQAEGKTIDGRSDLYSLGVVMYECLLGRVPFKGDNPVSTIHKIIYDKPPLTGGVGISLSKKEELVLRRSLEKNPSERFQTGEDLEAAICTFAIAQPNSERSGDSSRKIVLGPKPHPTKKQDTAITGSQHSLPTHPGTKEATITLQRRTEIKNVLIVVLGVMIIALLGASLYYFRDAMQSATRPVAAPTAGSTQGMTGESRTSEFDSSREAGKKVERLPGETGSADLHGGSSTTKIQKQDDGNTAVTESKPKIETLPSQVLAADVSVAELLFYERGATLPKNKRQYTSEFSAGSARFISWELALEHDKQAMETTLPLSIDWRDEIKDYRFFSESYKGIIHKGEQKSSHSSGRGWSTAGYWKPGRYSVVIMYKGRQLTKGEFTVVD